MNMALKIAAVKALFGGQVVENWRYRLEEVTVKAKDCPKTFSFAKVSERLCIKRGIGADTLSTKCPYYGGTRKEGKFRYVVTCNFTK